MQIFITILLSLLIKLNAVAAIDNDKANPSLTLFKDMEGECNNYCFGIVKPILQQTKQQQFTDLQDKIKDLYTIIKQTERQLAAALIKLGVCEDASKGRATMSDEQLKRRTEQMTELQAKVKQQEQSVKTMESQVQSMSRSLSVCEQSLKHHELQQLQLQDLNVACSNSSGIKDELINTNRALIEKQKAASQAEEIKLELKERRIRELTSQLQQKDNELSSQQIKLANQLAKSKQQADTLVDYTEQLSKCQASSCLGKSTEVHVIRLPGMEPFAVYCDSILADPGWTVIQRRRDGSVNFNRNWTDYRVGFGDLRGEFFIGLDKLHLMLKSQHHELYIYLQDFDDENRYARYDHFLIGSESDFFKIMSLGEYSGTAGDAMTSQKDMKFSTPDRDNDRGAGNCAKDFRAGWWYRKCYYCNLNGQYFNAKYTNQYGINWFSWHKNSLQFVQMMVRPKPH